ncbi:MAG: HNH endonuclease, partial [Acidimicrobiales bacterium]
GSVAETWDGRPVDPAAALRRCCDADWYVMVYDALGRPTRVGRSRRYATREQRLQLRGLYRTCPIDGVTPFHRCEVHHVNLDYELGGETELHNLVPISSEWHHRIHDGGWTLTMDADRTLRLFRPDGTLDRVIDPPTPITRHGP